MVEGKNIEIAHKLSESEAGAHQTWNATLLEIAEAVVLALVAVATAWSGFQSAKWDGRQALQYGASSRLRVEAAVAATEGGQQRLLDVMKLNEWVKAYRAKDEQLAVGYRHSFSPAFRVAFDAWLKTDPFTNPSASPGPLFRPEYHNALLEKSAQLNKEATTAFTEGTEAREISERYVRGTVLFATVLFLVALAQRFKVPRVRMGLFFVAAALMLYALANVASYPRL